MQAEVVGPGRALIVLSGLAAATAAFLLPALAPVWAAAWLVVLASQVRFSVTGGGRRPLSSREMAEYMAFFRLEPWGTEVEDWRAALIASTIANTARDTKRRRKPYEPKDFMPEYGPPKRQEEQSWEEQARILEMWARVLGENMQ